MVAPTYNLIMQEEEQVDLCEFMARANFSYMVKPCLQNKNTKQTNKKQGKIPSEINLF